MEHQPIIERQINGGTQKVYRFDNGQGASVVRHMYSYGSDSGKWELAVIRFTGAGVWDWTLDYTAPITDDVIGHLDWHEVESYLDQIAALPNQQLKEAA